MKSSIFLQNFKIDIAFKHFTILLAIMLLISCKSNTDNKADSKSSKERNSGSNEQSNKIKVGVLDLNVTRDVSVSNFKLVNSFLKQSVLRDGNDELFLIFTFDIINNGEDIFEKTISLEKAQELGLSSTVYSKEKEYAKINPSVYLDAMLYLNDINDIPGKSADYYISTALFNDEKKLVKFNSMNPMRKGIVYHGLGYIKFSNNMATSDDVNIDYLKNNIPFKPSIYLAIHGGTKSDFAKYHRVILDGENDISNLKDFGIDALKTKRNYYNMSNSNWFKEESQNVYKLLNLKAK